MVVLETQKFSLSGQEIAREEGVISGRGNRLAKHEKKNQQA
jgi:hypothetical protein